MYHHVKKLMYTVRVGAPDPTFGNMLLEQFGGANGELAAAMQYSIQGLNCDDLERKDLLMDIGTEELSHLEIVGALARLHLKPMKFNREDAEADPLIAIAGGGGVSLCNSMGHAWTADTTRALAGQIGRPDVAQLIATSLSEEENANNLPTHIAPALMGQTWTVSTTASKLVVERTSE